MKQPNVIHNFDPLSPAVRSLDFCSLHKSSRNIPELPWRGRLPDFWQSVLYLWKMYESHYCSPHKASLGGLMSEFLMHVCHCDLEVTVLTVLACQSSSATLFKRGLWVIFIWQRAQTLFSEWSNETWLVAL